MKAENVSIWEVVADRNQVLFKVPLAAQFEVLVARQPRHGR